jgi:hypothetical protein
MWEVKAGFISYVDLLDFNEFLDIEYETDCKTSRAMRKD